MKHIRQFVRCCLGGLFCIAFSSASPALDYAGAQEVVQKVLTAQPDMYAVCPADVYAPPRKPLVSASVTEQSCAAYPGNCHVACTVLNSGPHCFALARALQMESKNYHRTYEALFALACSKGYAAGCTNRGAGIRNGDYGDDPFAGHPAAKSCSFRSFRIACRGNDSWGCAMEGQSHFNGEGTRKQRSVARARFNKACRLGPDFEACEFARDFTK